MNKNKLLNLSDIDNLSIKEVKRLYTKYVSHAQQKALANFTFGNELVISAKGSWITTKSKKRYLDFTGGYGVLNLGHNHPRLLKARIDFQKKNKMEIHKNYLSQYTAALSNNISSVLPKDLNIVYLPNSGAEANEGAIKLAYKYHKGKRKFLLHSNISFHGKLLGTGSISVSHEINFKFPSISNTKAFIFDDIKSLKHLINKYKNNIYAIILEPFSASSMRPLSKNFLIEARKLCNENNIVLIFDEVFTGWGRMGSLFYFMKYDDLVPDILTFSKSFGGGKSSISGYVTKDNIYKKSYDNLQDFNLHSTTYNAFGEECITAIEAINILLDEDLVNMAKDKGYFLKNRLIKIKDKNPNIVKEVRGEGLLLGLKLNFLENQKILSFISKKIQLNERFLIKITYSFFIEYIYKRYNILMSFSQGNEICLWISPPLNVKQKDLDYFINSLDKCISLNFNRHFMEFIKTKLKYLN